MKTERESQLDELLADYLRRIDSGDFDRQAFLAEHPELAADLAELIDAADLVDQFAGPLETEVDLGATIALAVPVGAAQQQVDSLGDYDLLDQLGRGGMGVVYRAWQRSMDRHVAVKMILAGRLANEAEVQRFYDEARAAGSLRHRHIVAIYQVGEHNGRHFYSMDLIAGATLADRIADGPLPPEQAVKYLIPIAEATHFAHGRGVLHRDLKPSNVLIDVHDQPRITDFGLAKRLEQQPEIESDGSIVGTPSYMSPEQAAAREDLLGPATDVYSLGAVLYALLTGRPPFRGKNQVEVLLKVVHANPTDPRKLNPRVHRDLAAICIKCLHKDHDRRYANAQELADDLRRFQANEPVTAQPMSRWELASRWTLGIPLVAALVGRRAPAPSRSQWLTQFGIVAAPIAIVVAWLAFTLATDIFDPWPRLVRTGLSGGKYDTVAQVVLNEVFAKLGWEVKFQNSEGSQANLDLLKDSPKGLAIVQQDVLAGMDDELRVVTPLHPEYVHVLVLPAESFKSLREVVQSSKRFAIGGEGSGSASTAQWLLTEALGLLSLEEFDDQVKYVSAGELIHRDSEGSDIGAVIRVAGAGDEIVKELIEKGYTLISLPVEEIGRKVELGTWHKSEIPEGSYESQPPSIATFRTRSFLIAHEDAPGDRIKKLLEELYSEEQTNLRRTYELLEKREAARSTTGWHWAANDFFQ